MKRLLDTAGQPIRSALSGFSASVVKGFAKFGQLARRPLFEVGWGVADHPIWGDSRTYDFPAITAARILWWSQRALAFVAVLDTIDIGRLLADDGFTSLTRDQIITIVNFVATIVIGMYIVGLLLKAGVYLLINLGGGAWVSSSRPAHPDEYRPIYDLYQELFRGHEQMLFPVVVDLIDRKLLSLHVVFKEQMSAERPRRICGFFVIQLLSVDGLKNMLSGRKDGRHFESSDLVQSLARAKALYVGAMGGKSMQDRAFVMSEIIRYAMDVPDLRIFGRPSTRDGKRIASKYGWKPVEGPEGAHLEVWEGHRPSD